MTVPSSSTAPPRADTARSTRLLVVAALLLTGLSMRTAVTSVGAALKELEDGLDASGFESGLVTTMPVIAFAGIGVVTPLLARTWGPHRLLVLGLALTTIGLATRPFGANALVFAVISLAALAGAAVSNVLMPSLVKLHFPDRIGTLTAAYTTALAVGATGAAGLTVPIGDAAGSWRVGLATWAIVSAIAIVPWLPTVFADRRASAALPGRAVSLREMARSRTAWALAIFFGTQSMQAYITFGWFPRFLTDHGESEGTAGLMLAVLSALSIPVSLAVPRIPPRLHRPTVAFFIVCLLGAYVLMCVAPRPTAWVWMVLAGIGSGSFPLILTLLGTRARTPDSTATLSAFVQTIGYVIAGTGPLLFGALFGATGSWALPMTVLFVAVAVMSTAALPSTTGRYVDDDLSEAALRPS
ncbi:MFS transporter [Jatrophihabitans fulvus]